MERQIIYLWWGFFSLNEKNMENLKQNRCHQTDAFRRDRNYRSPEIMYFRLLTFLLGSGGVRKCHHYYFLAQVQDWLVRE